MGGQTVSPALTERRQDGPCAAAAGAGIATRVPTVQGLAVTRTSSQFEVHALRGTRWVIEFVSADGATALERGHRLLQRAEIDGVKVWQEIHDPSSGRTAGRLVLTETKP